MKLLHIIINPEFALPKLLKNQTEFTLQSPPDLTWLHKVATCLILSEIKS
ncbi:hypothetical protein YpsIP31758_2267 [Yersinia pseudotuberculosis IP 31758]|uniref:Uncharacterized protein n=1 Tax=Yersinia pseudotuberculosis serotype O:1b (strain IP 31758) TaxID=349747 RepID=A0A0U1R2R5_YERP3|nr:hypothetical protein YpsIP31758_2267 [Yersinia pseudotuberculosis IP 31758]